jgi:hypothetical protein
VLLAAWIGCLSVGAPPVPAASRCRPLAAGAVERSLAAGREVVERRVEIRGDLRLPTRVRGRLSLRDSCLRGDLVGRSSTFHSFVDLSGTSVGGRIDLSGADVHGPFFLTGTRSGARARFDFAMFRRRAVLDGAGFDGRTSFRGADFLGAAGFTGSSFARRVTFSQASFARGADFAGARFGAAARFRGADFRSIADFTAAAFSAAVSFERSRFGDESDFTSAIFGARRAPSFTGARLGTRSAFVGALFAGGANFAASTTPGNVDFDQATFQGRADFAAVRYGGTASFTGARFATTLVYDQAMIAALVLKDITLAADGIVLPALQAQAEGFRGGRIASLELDPAAVDRVRVGVVESTKETREAALSLVEAAARSAGDLGAANEARVRRLTLVREARPPVLREADWVVLWGIGGYLVRPSHPAAAVLLLVLVAALVRTWIHRRERAALSETIRGAGADLRASAGAVAGLRLGRSPWRDTEVLAHKALIVVLIISVGNVWPPARELLEAVIP